MKINDLIQVLADRGLSDEAIVNVRDGLWAQANETFMDTVLPALTNEDLEKVEASNTQEEANQQFIELYKVKTGKNMQEELIRIVDQYAIELIQKYKVEDGVPLPVTASVDSTEEGIEKKDTSSPGFLDSLPTIGSDISDEATDKVDASSEKEDSFFKADEPAVEKQDEDSNHVDVVSDKKDKSDEEEELIHDLN